jgi:hypothetical protein
VTVTLLTVVCAAAAAVLAAAAVALLRHMPKRRTDDGFRYWPMCPRCEARGERGFLSCVERVPENSVPARVYGFVCQTCELRSTFSHEQIMGMQPRRRREQETWGLA